MADEIKFEKVERFEPELDEHYYVGHFATMKEHPQGDYVRSSDYDALQSSLASLREERDAVRDVAIEMSREWVKQNGPGGWINDLRKENQRMLVNQAQALDKLSRVDTADGDSTRNLSKAIALLQPPAISLPSDKEEI